MPTVSLSAGPTHYEWSGAESAPPVVLVHGISIPLWNWDHVAGGLAQAGFRVLRYDMLGRGESAYPRCAYDRRLLVTQLLELLDALDLRAPVNLAGFSFGGAVSATFTATHPGRVARLALIAPFARMELPDRRKVVRLPLLGELLVRFKLRPELKLRAARLLRTSGDPAGYAARFAGQVDKPEFLRAFLSLSRTDALDDYGSVYEQVAAGGVPATLIWGTGDIDISRASIDYTRARLRPGRYLEVEGADHGSILQEGAGLDRLLGNIFSSR